tara:strand:- start:368 stop:2353 length:1986 start_codon:yes stop_codon:yes gene_type:complete
MLNRNNIFKTVRDTENTLNFSTGKKMDNFYTELLQYENTAQRRYDKIKNILESIRYHHNKIQNINKKYSNAIYGGSDDSDKLLKAIELAIDNIEILEKSLTESQFNTLIAKNIEVLYSNIGKDKNSIDIQKLTINEDNITENSLEFFTAAFNELNELKKELNENDQNISKILINITNVEPLLMKYINENKLVAELRESILTGFKAIKNEISIKKTTNLDNFTSYSTNIKNALTYAKANKNSVKSVDQQILTVFLKDHKRVVFKTKDHILEITGTKTDIAFEKEDTKHPVSTINVSKSKYIAIIQNSDLDLKFIIDNGNSPNGKLTINSFLEIIISDKYINNGKIRLYKKDLQKQNLPIENKAALLEKIKTIITAQSVRYVDVEYDTEINEVIFKKTIAFLTKTKEEEEQTVIGGSPGLDKDPSVIKLKEILKNIKSRILNNIGNNSDKKDKDKDKDKNKDKDNTTTNTNQPNAVTNSIISSIIKNYEKERKNINSIDQKIKLDAKFVDYLDNLGLNLVDIFKVNLNDKLVFIFFILVLHIVVYSIIESLIMNNYISDIVYIMAVYVGIYCVIMFILILILNKFVNYKIKATLNYLNSDFNLQLISMHIFMVFIFYIIVLLLSQHIDIFVAKDEDDKLQILYRIEVISSIIFIFSSVFVMLL